MSKDSINDLKNENERLRILATHDEMTGIFNRRAVEKLISETMNQGGSLYVCDLDGFKKINDQYGHLTGDECLIQTARLLTALVRTSDVVGRIGGDEFVLFAYGNHTEDTIEQICSKVQRGFAEYNRTAAIPLKISIAGSLYHEEDSYDSMFDRADQMLLRIKDYKHAHTAQNLSEENWTKDMSQIHLELMEQVARRGAFCQNFDSFKMIYRYLERRMRRNPSQNALLLLSLTEKDGSALHPDHKANQMNILDRIIQYSLRMGDVYTRYSSFQFLILLNDIDQEHTQMVAERIKESYEETNTSFGCMVYHTLALTVAKLISE